MGFFSGGMVRFLCLVEVPYKALEMFIISSKRFLQRKLHKPERITQTLQDFNKTLTALTIYLREMIKLRHVIFIFSILTVSTSSSGIPNSNTKARH